MDGDDVHDLDDYTSLTPGVVYLSSIPMFVRVNRVREVFGQFGKLGRVYLAPAPSVDGRRSKIFTEGWVEFRDKKKAKRAALVLDNTQLQVKKRSQASGQFWNVKYLSKFTWDQLNETVVPRYRVQMDEILQARREVNQYKDSSRDNNFLRGKQRLKMKRLRKGGDLNPDSETGHPNDDDVKPPDGSGQNQSGANGHILEHSKDESKLSKLKLMRNSLSKKSKGGMKNLRSAANAKQLNFVSTVDHLRSEKIVTSEREFGDDILSKIFTS